MENASGVEGVEAHSHQAPGDLDPKAKILNSNAKPEAASEAL